MPSYRIRAGKKSEALYSQRALLALVEDSHYQLIESLAEHVARVVIGEFGVPWLKVRVGKPGAVAEAEEPLQGELIRSDYDGAAIVGCARVTTQALRKARPVGAALGMTVTPCEAGATRPRASDTVSVTM